MNLYGTTEHAFAARHEALAALFGAWPAAASTNADLTLTGVQRSRETARTVEDRVVVDQSVGMLTADKGLDSESARRQLDGAADRAGIKTSLLAHVVIKGRLLG